TMLPASLLVGGRRSRWLSDRSRPTCSRLMSSLPNLPKMRVIPSTAKVDPYRESICRLPSGTWPLKRCRLSLVGPIITPPLSIGDCTPVELRSWLLGPVNTAFKLFETNEDEETWETPFLVPGAINLTGEACQPSTKVCLTAGYFHTIAFDQSNEILWVWGAGILGRGSEIYDPLPTPITFFNEANIKVRGVISAGDYSVAIASQPSQALEPPAQSLVYLWGYLPNSDSLDGQSAITKSLFPIVVKDLASDLVCQLAAIPDGCPPTINLQLPFQTGDQLSAKVPFHMMVGAGMVGLLRSKRLLLIDLEQVTNSDNGCQIKVAALSGVDKAALTEEGLLFITDIGSEYRLKYIRKDQLPFSILQPLQHQPSLPSFDTLVDDLASKTSRGVELAKGWTFAKLGERKLRDM
ncbi:hypothetical protein L0F63_003644, partial [Massospora cicadina]